VTQFAQRYKSLYRNIWNGICGHQRIPLAKPQTSITSQPS
jgi:hypothetical protein